MVRLAERSLVEQMGMTERELARRLHHLDFNDGDRKCMLAARPHIESALDTVVQEFYDAQLDDSEVASLIGDIDTLKRLKGTMRGYISSIFRANYDDAYVNNRLRIGKVHKRLGVSPKLYIAGLVRLQSLLDREIDEVFSGKKAPAHKRALHKIMLFDTQLVFEAYVDGFLLEVESAKKEVEKYAADLGIRVDSLTRHLHEISTKDALTGLFNRRVFYEHLERECDAAQRHNLPLTIAYFDLNGFKAVNDTHGHDEGDRVLRQVGEAMLAVTRAVDIAARYGGDEFCIIMPRTERDVVMLPLKRLMAEFDVRREHPVTFSIGVVQTGPKKIDEPRDIIRQADEKMYLAKARAKEDGGHHVEI